MFKLYNTKAITRKQRFSNALLMGGLVTIGCIAIILAIWFIFLTQFDLLYLAAGYGIAMAIQHFGKGVQIQFSILGAVLAAVVFVVCDIVCYGVGGALYMLSSFGIDSLLGVAYRLGAIYIGYQYSRII